jgi:hypothetical protein
LNLHQSPIHATFEELRVAPAIQRGNFVLSEESPFFSEVPYRELLFETSLEGLADSIEILSSVKSAEERAQNLENKKSEIIPGVLMERQGKFREIAARLR